MTTQPPLHLSFPLFIQTFIPNLNKRKNHYTHVIYTELQTKIIWYETSWEFYFEKLCKGARDWNHQGEEPSIATNNSTIPPSTSFLQTVLTISITSTPPPPAPSISNDSPLPPVLQFTFSVIIVGLRSTCTIQNIGYGHDMWTYSYTLILKISRNNVLSIYIKVLCVSIYHRLKTITT